MAIAGDFSFINLRGGDSQLLGEVVNGALVIHHWAAASSLAPSPEQIALAKARPIGHSSFDQETFPGIFREHSRGFLGAPMVAGHRDGKNWSTQFEITQCTSDGSTVDFLAVDHKAQLQVTGEIALDSFGVLTCNYQLTNLGDRYTLDKLTYWLPLSTRATQKLDFFGRWSSERQPQRSQIETGLWVRDTWEGRSGHNFTITQLALTDETNFSSGEVWSVALGWSGNSAHYLERQYDGSQWMGAGEIFMPGEVVLEQGESYQAPTLYASYSQAGLDGVASNYHRSLRQRDRHPKSPRPLTLNMWEAIYFDHSYERVKEIVDLAREIGVERVVLDDGWFGSRRNDKKGLGDWVVSEQVWPHGLKPISDYIRAQGMEFGLWFEGEMVNPDSDLYRAHPDWILQVEDRIPPLWRNQLVLDLSKSEVFDYLFEKISQIISENSLSYIKWDHNRVLVDAGSGERSGYRDQVRAIYCFFEKVKEKFPEIEIESCASGGGRIDLGIINYVDRFWASDNNDPIARLGIHRWSAQVIPPELLGSHIGPIPGHQSGRSTSLSTRAASALFGHAGIEWDISQTSDEDRSYLKNWISFYKSHRDWLHRGKMVRIDYPDRSALLYGTVSQDLQQALFTFFQISESALSHPHPLTFTGLDPEQIYLVRAISPAGMARQMALSSPPWMDTQLYLTGSELAGIGVAAPILAPEQALLIYLEAVDSISKRLI
jgi:alpha-galactosidase